MYKFKYLAVALCGLLLGFSAFAEGEAGANSTVTKVNTAVDGWVAAAKEAIEGWIDKLSPLFMVGIGIVLLLLGWALFKKVTNKAKG